MTTAATPLLALVSASEAATDVAPSVAGYRATFDDLERGDHGPSAVRPLIGWFRERADA